MDERKIPLIFNEIIIEYFSENDKDNKIELEKISEEKKL